MVNSIRIPANATPGFAIEIGLDTNLGLAILLAEDEEGHCEPVAVVARSRSAICGGASTKWGAVNRRCARTSTKSGRQDWTAAIASPARSPPPKCEGAET